MFFTATADAFGFLKIEFVSLFIKMEEQLIKFVRENSFIYDKKHDLYRNLVLKNKKWIEFAKYVNVPGK